MRFVAGVGGVELPRLLHLADLLFDREPVLLRLGDATLGFLLLISLVVSTALHALSDYVNAYLPFGAGILSLANFLVSFALIAFLFAAIYKILPDRPLAWRDVLIGAVGTTGLFEVGKWLIALYIGSSTIASSYGAAGALIVVLLWIYYTAQIFLFGAEFTKVYASRRGSKTSAVELRTHAPSRA
jgi:membrane protein